MWIPNDVIASVDEVARIRYIDVAMCQMWNQQRQNGEIRLLTGWVWTARKGGLFRQGFKSKTVTYRDAYYALVLKQTPPSLGRNRNG